MGKAGRWLRSILGGKKDGGRRGEKRGQYCDATPLAVLPAAASPREKKRWSFRRPAQPGKAAAAPSPLTPEPSVSGAGGGLLSASELELEQSKHAVAVAVATAAAADAAVAAAHAAAAVMRLTAVEYDLSAGLVEEAAAVRIQATFRGYLSRKALCALRGLVKLQAVIRGQLVRKQANATLRRMQALLMAQTRLRTQRMRMLEEDDHAAATAAARRSPQHPRRRRSYEMDRSGEEHAKIVEMDMGEPPQRGRSSCSVAASESRERRRAEYLYGGQCSPAPSAAFTELMSPRAYSGHFEDFAPFEPATARCSPYVYVPGTAGAGADGDGEPASEFYPNYMANTQSSRAKARSQSAPRQRTDSPSPLERQPSRRRGSAAPVPRSVKMQRSSSHVGVPNHSAAAAYAQYQYQYYPLSVKLDRSSASLKDSECGSTSSVLTAATTVGYCRSLVGFEMHRSQY